MEKVNMNLDDVVALRTLTQTHPKEQTALFQHNIVADAYGNNSILFSVFYKI